MNRFTSFSIPLAVCIGAFFAAGCGASTSTLQGRILNTQGTQPQSSKLGGTATVSSTTVVRVSSVETGGSLSTVANASVKADGSYTVQVPAGQRRLVIDGLDASGTVTASAIVESTGTAGQTVTVTPMDTESSVEAQVFIATVVKGQAVSDIDTIDLRTRINSNVAGAVAASTDSQTRINALAEGVIAAQQTQVKVYSHEGLSVTQDQLFEAQLTAAVTLDAALDSSSTSAYSDFTTSYDTAIEGLNVSAKVRAEAESAAAASFRATVQARLGAPDAVTDSSFRAAAVLEAHVTTRSVNLIFNANSAGNATVGAASTAATTLETSIANASTSAQASAAFTTYVSTMTQTNGSSALGSFVSVNGGNQAVLDAAVTISTTASQGLETGLDTAFSTTLSLNGNIDFGALATSVSASYATLETTLQAQASALSVFAGQAQPTVDVLIVVRSCGHSS